MSLTPEAEGFREVAGGKPDKRLNSPLLIPEEAFENFSRPVSWLGASNSLGLPVFQTVTQGQTSPLTVAGPRRIRTGFPNTLSWFT